MIETILLVLLWLMIAFHATGAFLTLCRVVRYKDVFVNLDADRIAHQPFQPKISVVVRCGLEETDGAVGKVQELLALNYTRYEVILIVDSACSRETFGQMLDYFELQPVPVSDELRELRYPTTAVYRSRSRVYGRLTVVDKAFREDDDLRVTGAAVCKADYMLFIRSLDNELARNSLARLAIMKMRDPLNDITTIRGVARYDCGNRWRGNVFRSLTALCNLRRLYITGSIKKNDFGQFMILEDISGKKGEEELVPEPQMFLHRPNHLRTYMLQLAPRIRHKTLRGKLISFMEFLFGVLFWASAIHVAVTPGIVNVDFIFLLTILILPLLASTFSVFVGEILLKENAKIRFVVRLLLLSFVEALLFCLFIPWVWIVTKLFPVRKE